MREVVRYARVLWLPKIETSSKYFQIIICVAHGLPYITSKFDQIIL